MLHGLSNGSFSSAFNIEGNDPSARAGHSRRGKSVVWIGRMPLGVAICCVCTDPWGVMCSRQVVAFERGHGRGAGSVSGHWRRTRACWDAHERLSTESMNQYMDPHGSLCIDGIFGMEQTLADGVCLLSVG